MLRFSMLKFIRGWPMSDHEEYAYSNLQAGTAVPLREHFYPTPELQPSPFFGMQVADRLLQHTGTRFQDQVRIGLAAGYIRWIGVAT